MGGCWTREVNKRSFKLAADADFGKFDSCSLQGLHVAPDPCSETQPFKSNSLVIQLPQEVFKGEQKMEVGFLCESVRFHVD